MSTAEASIPSAGAIDLTVELGPRSYPIRVLSGTGPAEFGAFARAALDAKWAGKATQRALIVTDENVSPKSPPFEKALRDVGIEATLTVLPPGEPTKNLDHAEDLLDHLVALRADRHMLVMALGGGVVGDLAGFVAAIYARGIPLLMVPTSLLAQVDSSVGGKVGVNLPRAKNIVGSFHQPVGVWIDTETLKTLPARELRCGLAEVVKHGVILDAPFFEYLEAHAEAILALEPSATRHVVATCCRIKAGVVSKDEREETGLRAVLNFGHTIGHAVETVAGYGQTYLHGEAVAVGMIAECRLAEKLGWIDGSVTRRIETLLERFGLPISCQGLECAPLLDAMTRDKKNRSGRIRFVLPHAIGQTELTDAFTTDEIKGALFP